MSTAKKIMVNKSADGKSYSKILFVIKFLMIASGLWMSGSNHRTNLKILTLFCVIMGSGCYFIIQQFLMFVHKDEIMEATETLMFFILFARVMLGYFLMVKNKDDIEDLVKAIEVDFQGFGHESSLVAHTNQCKRKGERNTLLFICLMVVALSMLFLSYGWSSEFYRPNSDTKSQIFPMSAPKVTEHDHNMTTYYATYVFELVVCSASSLLSVVDITMCVGSVNLICAELDILSHAFRNARTDLTLVGCIKQHCFLIRLAYNVQSVLSYIVMDMFVTCEFMLCLCSFQIYQIYSTTTLASLMKNICMLSALIVHEFVYFFYGQRLVTKTSNLHQSVYFCRWYNESKSFRSSLSIIQCRTSKPFIIMAGKIVPVTLASFIKCLQAAFSYFNLLRALSHT